MEKKWKSAANIKAVTIKQNDPGVSITQPDESLSIREILHRVSQGLTTGLGDTPFGEYDEENDEDFDDPTLDPEFDRLDALAHVASPEADDLREQERNERKRVRRKKEEDAFNAEVEKRIREKQVNQNQEPGNG